MTARRIARWGRLLSLLPTAAWYGVIWSLSAQPASVSGSLSDGLLYRLMVLCSPAFAAVSETVRITAVEALSFFERKAAHMFLYFVLSLLAFSAACFFLRRFSARAAAAAVLCVLLASLDEYHQTMVPGRSGEVRDVLVDLCGSLIALGFLALPLAASWCRRSLNTPLVLFLIPAVLCLLCICLVLVPVKAHESSLLSQWIAVQYLPDGTSQEEFSALQANLAPVLRDLLFLISSGAAGVCLPLAALLAGPRWRAAGILSGAAIFGAAALSWTGSAASPLPAGLLAMLGILGIVALWEIAATLAAWYPGRVINIY